MGCREPQAGVSLWLHPHPGAPVRPVASSSFVRPCALLASCVLGRPWCTLEGQLGLWAPGWCPDRSWALGSSVPSPQSPLSLRGFLALKSAQVALFLVSHGLPTKGLSVPWLTT